MDTEYILQIVLRARDEMATAFAAARGELSQLRTEVRGLDKDLEPLNDKITSLTRRLGTLKNRIAETNTVFKENRDGIRDTGDEFQRLEQSVRNIGGTFNSMRANLKASTEDTREYNRVIKDTDRDQLSWVQRIEATGIAMQGAGIHVKSLGSEMRGLMILGVVAFFQQIATAAVALGGNLVALASSAAFAGAAIGGAFAAGAAQSIPIIGLLAASVQRLGDVFQALKLRQQAMQQEFTQQQQRDKKSENSMNAVANAADGVVSAQERLADAERGVTKAQERVPQAQEAIRLAQQRLTDARKEAVDELGQLIFKEKEAELAARGASLSVEEAQRNLRDALGSGDSLRIEQARLQVDVSRNAASEARRNLVQTKRDNAEAAAKGVEGSSGVQDASRGVDSAKRSAKEAAEAVKDAQRGVADAQRGISQAQRALENAKRTSDVAQNNAVTAQRNLEFFLEKQLSGSERKLYNILTKISDDYYAIVRQATDRIIDSFTFVATKVERLLRDPRIKGAMVDLAGQIGAAIGSIGDFLTSDDIVDQFLKISKAAGDNLGPVTEILKDVLEMFGDIAEAAGPSLNQILTWIEAIVDKWKEFISGSNDSGELTKFFELGTTHLEAWVDLLGSVINLFLAISGEGGGAASGLRIIQRITDGINGWAEAVRNNSGKVQEFFKQSEDVLGNIWTLVKTIAIAIAEAFDPETVEALVNILVKIVVPALKEIITTIGDFVSIVEKVLSIGPIGQIILWIGVFLGLVKAVTVIFGAVGTGLRTFALAFTGLQRATTLVGALRAAFINLPGGIGKATAAFKLYEEQAERAERAAKRVPASPGAYGGTRTSPRGRGASGAADDDPDTRVQGSQTGAMGSGAFITTPDGQRVLANSPAGKRAQASRQSITSGTGTFVTLPDGSRAPRNSPAAKRAQQDIVEQDRPAAEAENAERDRAAKAEADRAKAATRAERRATAGRAVKGVGTAALVTGAVVAAQSIDFTGGQQSLDDVKKWSDQIGGLKQDVKDTGAALQSLISFDLGGFFRNATRSSQVFAEWVEKAEGNFKKFTDTGNVKGLRDLSDQAEKQAKKWPEAADALKAFADRAEAAAKKAEGLAELTKKLGDRADDLKAYKLKVDDLIDPDAARLFLSNMTRINQGGITGIEDLRKNMQFNLTQIGTAFKTGSASWQESITLNAGQGIAQLKKAMEDGVISVTDGTKEIARITRQQMRFMRDNMDDLSDEAKNRLSDNFQAALDVTIDKAGGIEKATGDSLRRIRKLMAAQFQLFGLTEQEAGQLARNRTSHDPNRRRLDQNNRPEEGSAGLAVGGWVGNEGERGGDTQPALIGRGEAVLNWAHQKAINVAMAGRDTLSGIFRRVRGEHGERAPGGFATGREGANLFDGHPSNVNSGVRNLTELMKRLFPLTVYSTTDHSRLTTSGNVSDHTVGAAVDLAGSPEVMLRAADYVKSSGLYKKLKQGIHNPNLAVNAGQLQTPPGQFAGAVWSQHANHLHLAITGAIGKLKGGVNAAVGEIKDQTVKGADKAGTLGLFAQTGVDVVTMAANRMLQRISESQGGVDATASDTDLAPGFKGPWVAVMSKIAQENRWNLSDWRALVSGESGGNPAARNPSSGAYGLGQFLGSTATAYAKYGALSSDGSDQIRAMAKYIADRYHDPSNAYHTWLSRNPHWYEHGGPLPFERGKPGMFVGHGGEWVVNESQQSKLAQMTGGSVSAIKSALGFSGGPTSFAGGGELSGGGTWEAFADILKKLPGAIAKAVKEAAPTELPFQRRDRVADVKKGNYEFPDIVPISPEGLINEAKLLNTALKNVDKKTKESFTKYVSRFSKELDNLTGENGILTLLPASIERRNQIRATNLNADTIGRRGGILARTLTPDQVTARQISDSEQEARDLRAGRGQFETAQKEAQGQLSGVDDRISALKRGGTTKKEQTEIDALLKRRATLTSQIRTIGEGIRGLDDSIANNVANRYQLQLKQFTDEIAKTEAAQVRSQGITQFRIRMAQSLGQDTGGLQALLQSQIVQQINSTQAAVGRALAMGEGDLAQSLQEKVEDLQQSLQEMAVANFEASVQAIADRAAQRSNRIDITERALKVGLGGAVGQALGITGSSQNAIFTARGNSLQTQQGELRASLAVAAQMGNIKAMNELTDQIAELDVAIAENTLEARQARIDATNARAQRGTGILGGALGVVQTLGALPGQTLNTGAAQTLLQGIGGVLGTQAGGLRNELSGLGFSDVGDLSTPEGISSFVSRVLPWLETLPEAQRDQAAELVNGLIENTAATVDNTSQLEDLTGAKGQSFSSTAWTMFRTAILNGNGQLLPSLNGLVPSFADGGRMPWDGLANLHAGEIILNPAKGQFMDGDTHYHITTPVEKLDGTTLARETAWARKTQGRM